MSYWDQWGIGPLPPNFGEYLKDTAKIIGLAFLLWMLFVLFLGK